MSNKGNSNADKCIGMAMTIGLIIAVLFIYAIVKYFWAATGDGEASVRGELGQMGDYFGGLLNPFFAFVSFMALLYTINLQTKEMKAAREEAEASRREAQNSVAALNAQVAHMKNEAIRSDLYRMIELAGLEVERLLKNRINLGGSSFQFIYTFGPEKTQEYFRIMPFRYDTDHPEAIKVIFNLAQQLSEVGIYLSEYEKHGGHRSIKTYYSRRYGDYALSLYEKDYITEEIKNAFDFSKQLSEPSPTSYTDTSPQPQE